ncbi:hypothetical protein SPRG_12380 [Saprolegnia parasitica CBS 223.65]|uniref:Uncharacterized protein n=1 Tax=Saprolegnia parasitica (strain CBS 223.65) TaxID=695850 RepID=A0A067BUD1_SAPPC|nr:hypothetical protein SPRG_12380 [Saprolegnia parasitica CBS 223.65]KDO21878.1 hypothetical protein SPRG_12380 [Saprolegnia parasitica CBS 223.65]|eukprot:XP_012207433.1 hypothetical protein SPRG_12380 [Saprolegnia parasitica CBS 223.65]
MDSFLGWPLGVLLSAIASIIGVLGKILLKLSFQRRSRAMWATGMACIVLLNPLFCISAFNFAPQSLLAPMGGLCIVWNTIFSPWILDEPLWTRDIVGAGVVFASCILVSITGSHETHKIPVDELASHFTSIAFEVYFGLFLASSLALRYFARAAFHASTDSTRHKTVSCRVSLAILAGSLSGQLYCMTALLRLLQNGVKVLFTTPLAYLVGAGALSFALTGLRFLNLALRLYDALFVIYLYESTLLATGAISGICFFNDMSNESLVRWVLYSVGVGGIFLGIGIISESIKLRAKSCPIEKAGEASQTLLA